MASFYQKCAKKNLDCDPYRGIAAQLKTILVTCFSRCLNTVTSYVHIIVYMSLTCYCWIRLIHAVISNQVKSTFSALRKQGLKQKLLNSEPI